MRQPSSLRCLVAITFGPAALASCLASAALGVAERKPASDSTAEDINACVRQNFPDASMVQSVSMVMTDSQGSERKLEAEMFWEKDPATELSHVLLSFENPPELRCAAVLVREKKPENDMFMFVPELGKVRRITNRMVSGNMMGTTFSYDDFSRLQGMISNLETERLADDQVSGHPVFVTQSRPTPGSEYDSIRSLIDQETCVPLRVEFYPQGAEKPAKVLTVDRAKVSAKKSHWIPREIQLEDLAGSTSTRLVVEKLEINVPIDRKRFSETELLRRGRCRAAMSMN